MKPQELPYLGRHGVLSATWEQGEEEENTIKLKCEASSASSEMADKQKCQELQAAFAVLRVLERHKLPNETFMEYKKALRRTGKDYKIPEAFYVAAFINGVGKQQLSHLLKESNPKDLDTAAKDAILLERSDGAGPSLLGEQENKRPRVSSPALDRRDRELPPKRPRQDSRRCYQCQQFGHIARDCREAQRQRWDRR